MRGRNASRIELAMVVSPFMAKSPLKGGKGISDECATARPGKTLERGKHRSLFLKRAAAEATTLSKRAYSAHCGASAE
jgi:hypothetical protein